MRKRETPFWLLTAVVLIASVFLVAACDDLTQTGQSGAAEDSTDAASSSGGSTSTVVESTSTSTGPTSTLTADTSTSTSSNLSSTTTTKAPTPTTAKKLPVITGLNPDWCALDAQGAEVIITGSGFTGVFSVTFRGVEAMDFRFNSDTRITAYAPILGEGTVDVRVVTPAGMSKNTSADDFTYVDQSPAVSVGPPQALTPPFISSVSPDLAEITPGATIKVIITGGGFDWSSQVYFGGEPASAWVVDHSSQITAYAAEPLGPGTVDVQVVNSMGASPNTPADDFTWMLPHPPAP